MTPDVSGTAHPNGLGDVPAERPGRAVLPWIAWALDLLIVTYALGLAVILATGGVTLGVLRLNEPANPILVLVLLIPLRVTLGHPSRLAFLWGWPIRRGLARVRTLAWDRLPPAVVDVAFAMVATRLASFFVSFMAGLLFARYRVVPFRLPFEREKFAQVVAGWDSGWFFDIASRGYHFDANGQSSIAFFPLYPMLMRAVAWPFGGSDRAVWLAGIFVSYAACALALFVLHRFTQQVSGSRDVARRTVLYLAVFPFSLFLTRVYAESVFLLTSVLAVSQAYNGRWSRAGMWGGLAALARPNGILIAVPLVVLALGGRPGARVLGKRLAALTLVPLGLASYCAYVYTLSGDPLAWLSAQQHWGYSLGHPPWEQLLKMIGRLAKYGFYDYFFVSALAPFRLLHGMVALIFLALTPALFKRLGAGMGCYVLASLLVPLSGNALEGVGRYCAVLFPVFMLLGSFKSPRLHEAVLITGSFFLGLLGALFSTGHPIY